MNVLRPFSAVIAFVMVGALATPSRADKVPDLAHSKLKDLVKYLSLTPAQEEKIRSDVEHIQDIVRQAQKQTNTFGAGPRTPVGGRGVLGPGAPGSGGGGTTGHVEEMTLQREEWQKEINNRVEEIKTMLTPPQIEKFKAILLPDLLAPRQL